MTFFSIDTASIPLANRILPKREISSVELSLGIATAATLSSLYLGKIFSYIGLSCMGVAIIDHLAHNRLPTTQTPKSPPKPPSAQQRRPTLPPRPKVEVLLAKELRSKHLLRFTRTTNGSVVTIKEANLSTGTETACTPEALWWGKLNSGGDPMHNLGVLEDNGIGLAPVTREYHQLILWSPQRELQHQLNLHQEGSLPKLEGITVDPQTCAIEGDVEVVRESLFASFATLVDGPFEPTSDLHLRIANDQPCLQVSIDYRALRIWADPREGGSFVGQAYSKVELREEGEAIPLTPNLVELVARQIRYHLRQEGKPIKPAKLFGAPPKSEPQPVRQKKSAAPLRKKALDDRGRWGGLAEIPPLFIGVGLVLWFFAKKPARILDARLINRARPLNLIAPDYLKPIQAIPRLPR